MNNLYDPGELRIIMETLNVPEVLIHEVETKPTAYQARFVRTIREIMQNEVLNLITFLEMREKIQKKYDDIGIQ